MQWIVKNERESDTLGVDDLSTTELIELVKQQRARIAAIQELAAREIWGHRACDGCEAGRLAMLDRFGLQPPSTKHLVIGMIDLDDDDNFNDWSLDDYVSDHESVNSADFYFYSYDAESGLHPDTIRTILTGRLARQLRKIDPTLADRVFPGLTGS